MIGFDLFCGDGLASRGMADNGVSTLIGVDNMDCAVETYGRNFALGWNMEIENSEDVAHRLLSTGHSFGIGWASPPCTEHSPAKNGPKDENINRLAVHAALIARRVKPRVFIMENHKNMLKHECFKQLKNLLHDVYGEPQVLILCAHKNFGLGVRRERAFIVFGGLPFDESRIEKQALSARDHVDFSLPVNPKERIKKLVPKTRMAVEALLSKHGGGVMTYNSTRDYRSFDDEHRTLTCVSSNIYAYDGSYRMITIDESRRLQGMPDHHKLIGTTREQFRMIGNGVHVAVAREIVKQVIGLNK